MDLGANFVRLPVAWEQIEPAPPVNGVHTYDSTYLSYIDEQVAYYQSQQVNVVIDAHQSGWSSYFSPITDNGRGEPPWLFEGKYPIDQQGLAHSKADFFTSAQVESWYGDLLTMLVNRYSQYSNVVGYEIFNEPQGGSLGSNHAVTQLLVDWQSRMAHLIAALDPGRTVFLFTRAGGDLGLENADFSALADLPHVAMDLHDYYNGQGGLTPDGEDWTPSWNDTHNQMNTVYTGTLQAQEEMLVRALGGARDHGWPVLVGEWGAKNDDPGMTEYQTQMLTLFARYRVSWTRWQLTSSGSLAVLNNDGSPNAAGLQLQQALATTPTGLLNDGLPKISGSMALGSTLTASGGQWTGPVDTYRYQWLRCGGGGSGCTDIAGATQSTYTVTLADSEARLRVRVDVTGPDGASTALSASSPLGPWLAPVNVGLPDITGQPTVGQLLQASNGTWTGTVTSYAYQWLRCDAGGGNCVPIDLATKARYTAKAADALHPLAVRVSAIGPGGTTSATSAQTTPIAPVGIVNVTAPTISGSPVIGSPLKADKGTWSGTISSYAYQWLRCAPGGGSCTPIAGATNSGYSSKTGDIGSSLAVKVTATGPKSQVSATSAPTAPIAPVGVRNTSPPTISGSTVVGQKLTADKGTWSGTIDSYAYQWLSCDGVGNNCTAIDGATNSGYTSKPADIGHALAVRVTASGPGGTATATSAATAPITPVGIKNTSPPTIAGRPVIGQVLTLDRGTWTGTIDGYANQWLSCDANGNSCVAIAGRTGTNYTVAVADFGRTLRARVTASGPGGSDTALAAATAVVTAARIVNVSQPTATGTPVAGTQLAADKGGWTGTITDYAYQWLRCNAGGGTCAPIAGKNGSKYVVADADVGQTLRVSVTASGPGGSLAVSSAATAVATDLAPANTQPPVLNGTPVLGHGYSLSISNGTWDGSNLVYSYRWERCDANGANCTDMGITTKSYKLVNSDLGYRIRAYVRATNQAGTAEVATTLTPVIVNG